MDTNLRKVRLGADRRRQVIRRVAEAGFDSRMSVEAPRRTLGLAGELLGCCFAVLWLRGPTGSLRVLETYGAPQGLSFRDVEPHRLPEFEGARALASGQLVAIDDVDAADLAPGSRALLQELKDAGITVKSMVICPLLAHGDSRGLLTFCWSGANRWRRTDLDFFSLVATLMATVVDNWLLRLQLDSHLSELDTLLHIASACSSSLDVDTVFHQVLPKVRSLFQADDIGVAFLTDDGSDLLPTKYLLGYEGGVPLGVPEALRLSAKPWVQEALRTGMPVFVADYMADPRIGAVERWVFPAKSAAVIPLMADTKPLGVMFANWRQSHRKLEEGQLRLLEVVGQQFGRFLANAKLYSDAQLQNRYLRAAGRVALALASFSALPGLLTEICRQTVDALGAALAEIFLLKEDLQCLKGAALYGPHVTDSDVEYFIREVHPVSSPLLLTTVVREGRTAAVRDAQTDNRVTPAWARRHGVGPLLFVPLKRLDGRPLGVMTLAKRSGELHFSAVEVGLVEGVARQASVAIERTLLHEEQDQALKAVTNLAWLNHWRAMEFEALIRHMTEGVVVLRASGEIDTANRAARELLEVETPDDVLTTLRVAKMYDTRCNPIQEGLDPLSRLLRGETFRNYVLSVSLPTGHSKYLSFSGTKVVSDDGKVHLSVMVISDVTEHHRLEIARNEFISDLFHDLVTPVTVIKLAAQNSLKRLSRGYSADTIIEHLRTIVKRSDDVGKLLALLIDLSKVEADAVRVSPQWFDLSEALGSWVEEARVSWPEHKIISRLQKEVKVYADPEAVHRVFENVVNNAGRYSPPGTEIYVCVATDGMEAYVAIRDQGAGISSEHHERVFERYYRTVKGGLGMGIGLYLSKKLMEAQAGRVWLTSAPGHGTTVFLSLPTTLPVSN